MRKPEVPLGRWLAQCSRDARTAQGKVPWGEWALSPKMPPKASPISLPPTLPPPVSYTPISPPLTPCPPPPSDLSYVRTRAEARGSGGH